MEDGNFEGIVLAIAKKFSPQITIQKVLNSNDQSKGVIIGLFKDLFGDKYSDDVRSYLFGKKQEQVQEEVLAPSKPKKSTPLKKKPKEKPSIPNIPVESKKPDQKSNPEEEPILPVSLEIKRLELILLNLVKGII